MMILLAFCIAVPTACDAQVVPSAAPAPELRGDAQGSRPDALLERYQPLEDGPLALDSLISVHVRPRPVGGTRLQVSPDGQAFIVYDTINGLGIRGIADDGEMTMASARVSVPGFGYADTLPFVWAAGSDAILGVRQPTVNPSGFALGPMQPIRISRDGSVEKLPSLTYESGSLDGLLWVGNNGLALAEFDTKGGYYRPERTNPTPTLAMVNAIGGEVLHTVPVPNLLENSLGTRVMGIDALIDQNGAMRVLFSVSSKERPVWYLWEQGQDARPLSLDLGKRALKHFALVSGGNRVLVMRGLSASGIICERNPNCPKPTPSRGAIAELRDLNTGKVIWSIDGTAHNFSSTIKPVISSDGQFAVIAMPGNAENPGEGRSTLALISMRDGKVLQHIAPLSTASTEVTFAKDGRSVSIAAHSQVAVYRFQN